MVHIHNRKLVAKLAAISDAAEDVVDPSLFTGEDEAVIGWRCTKPYSTRSTNFGKTKTKKEDSQLIKKSQLPPLPLQWKNIANFASDAVKPVISKSEKENGKKQRKKSTTLDKKKLEKLISMTKHYSVQDSSLNKEATNGGTIPPTVHEKPHKRSLSPVEAERRFLPLFMNQIPNLDRELLEDKRILKRLRTISSSSKRYGATQIALHYGLSGPELRGNLNTPKLPTVKSPGEAIVAPHGKKRRSRLSNSHKHIKKKVDHVQKRLKDLSNHVLYPAQHSEANGKEGKDQWVHVQCIDSSIQLRPKANVQSTRGTLTIPSMSETGDGYDWKFAPLLPPILNQHIKLNFGNSKKRFFPKKPLNNVTAITQANQKVGYNSASILKIKRSVVTPVLPKVAGSSLQDVTFNNPYMLTTKY
ncbi:uncharacterized protein LOC100180940 [Ciona intestinalis]